LVGPGAVCKECTSPLKMHVLDLYAYGPRAYEEIYVLIQPSTMCCCAYVWYWIGIIFLLNFIQQYMTETNK